MCVIVSSAVSLHPGLQGSTSCSYSTQENIVAAIVQRAAAEAAARSSRQSSVDAPHQPLQLPVSSTSQVANSTVQCELVWLWTCLVGAIYHKVNRRCQLFHPGSQWRLDFNRVPSHYGVFARFIPSQPWINVAGCSSLASTSM